MTASSSQVSEPSKSNPQVKRELSGSAWVSRFPGSKFVLDLDQPYRSAFDSFVRAVRAAGIGVEINGTYRPPERAYLMHYSVKIAKGQISPSKVPPMKGVDIQWEHATLLASKAAAASMMAGYGIVHPPVIDSQHVERTGIDMTIKSYLGKTIVDANGDSIVIRSRSDLYAVGKTYGVLKLVGDDPHWSQNGH